MLYEIHGYGVPRLLWDGQLLEHAIRLMSLRLRAHAVSAGLAIVLDSSVKAWPCIFLLNEGEGFGLIKVAGENVVML